MCPGIVERSWLKRPAGLPNSPPGCFESTGLNPAALKQACDVEQAADRPVTLGGIVVAWRSEAHRSQKASALKHDGICLAMAALLRREARGVDRMGDGWLSPPRGEFQICVGVPAVERAGVSARPAPLRGGWAGDWRCSPHPGFQLRKPEPPGPALVAIWLAPQCSARAANQACCQRQWVRLTTNVLISLQVVASSARLIRLH